MVMDANVNLWGELRSLLNDSPHNGDLPAVLWLLLSQDRADALEVLLPYCKAVAPELSWDFVEWCLEGMHPLLSLLSEAVYPEVYSYDAAKLFLCSICWLATTKAPLELCSCVVKVSTTHFIGCCLGADDPISLDNFESVLNTYRAQTAVWQEFVDVGIEHHIVTPHEAWPGLRPSKAKPRHAYASSSASCDRGPQEHNIAASLVHLI